MGLCKLWRYSGEASAASLPIAFLIRDGNAIRIVASTEVCYDFNTAFVSVAVSKHLQDIRNARAQLSGQVGS